jgi:hypothetical protein
MNNANIEKLNRYGNPARNKHYRTQYQNVVRNTVTGRFESKDWWKLLKKKARSGFKNLAVLDTRLFD